MAERTLSRYLCLSLLLAGPGPAMAQVLVAAAGVRAPSGVRPLVAPLGAVPLPSIGAPSLSLSHPLIIPALPALRPLPAMVQAEDLPIPAGPVEAWWARLLADEEFRSRSETLAVLRRTLQKAITPAATAAYALADELKSAARAKDPSSAAAFLSRARERYALLVGLLRADPETERWYLPVVPAFSGTSPADEARAFKSLAAELQDEERRLEAVVETEADWIARRVAEEKAAG